MIPTVSAYTNVRKAFTPRATPTKSIRSSPLFRAPFDVLVGVTPLSKFDPSLSATVPQLPKPRPR